MNLILMPDDEQETPLPARKILGAVIRRLRGMRSLNAKQLGVDENTVWKIESGMSFPSLLTLFKIAKELHVTPWYILKAADHYNKYSTFKY